MIEVLGDERWDILKVITNILLAVIFYKGQNLNIIRDLEKLRF